MGAAGDALGHRRNQPGNSSEARRTRALLPAVGISLALLTACGGSPTMVAPATSTPPVATVLPATPAVPASATPIPQPPGLGEVRWSSEATTSATPVPGVTQLTSDVPRIVANVPANALPTGSQVSATWTYNNTSLDAFATTLTIDQLQPEQWLTFQLSRNTDTPWPSGVYEITISLNGQVAQTSSIEVIP
jgi:hypothetical protein